VGWGGKGNREGVGVMEKGGVRGGAGSVGVGGSYGVECQGQGGGVLQTRTREAKQTRLHLENGSACFIGGNTGRRSRKKVPSGKTWEAAAGKRKMCRAQGCRSKVWPTRGSHKKPDARQRSSFSGLGAQIREGGRNLQGHRNRVKKKPAAKKSKKDWGSFH